MKKLINILAITGLFLVILTSLGWGQIEGDFQTNGNTNFVDATNWQKYNSTLGWVVADHAPTYNDGVITVRNGNIATVTTITTIDQVIVNSGGKIEINSGITLNILNNTLSKNDVSVYGTLKNAGTVNLATSPTATMYFAAGGTYEHNYATSAGTIPSATWEVGSNCLISGYTTCSTPPGGLNQTFGYFTWNCPNQSADINLGNNLATVKGNFRMVSTGTGTNMLTLIDANLVTSSDFDFSITGDLIIQGGILNLASGTVAVGKFVRLNMYSNFLQTGGTFQNSSTSIIYQKFYGTGSTFEQSVGTFNPNNVSWAVFINADLLLNSDFVLGTNGSLNLYAASLSDNGGKLDCGTYLVGDDGSTGKFDMGAKAILITANTDGLDGSIQTATQTYASGASFTYNGSTPQTTGYYLPSIVLNLTIDNNNGVTLNKDNSSQTLQIQNELKLSHGNFIIMNPSDNTVYTITLGTTAANLAGIGILTIENNNLIVNGKMKRYIQKNAIVTYTFPLGYSNGTNTYNNSVILYDTCTYTSSNNTGTLTVEFIKGDPLTSSNVPITDFDSYNVNTYSDYGYWKITSSNSTYTAGKYTINLYAHGFTGISSDATKRGKLRILKRNTGSANPWTFPTGSLHKSATGTNTTTVAYRSGYTSFSEFAIGSDVADNSFNGPLPVSLASFNFTINKNDVELKWMTSSEQNNSGFDVERKTIEGNWSKVGFITGNGSKTTPTNYSYKDNNLATSKYNYRLKQIDNNGNFEYHNLSGVVEVGVPTKFNLSQNYPNPFNPTTKIDFELPKDGNVNIKVFDLTGKEVMTLVNDFRAAGYYTVSVDASKLSSGVYFYNFSSNGFTSTKKMAVIK